MTTKTKKNKSSILNQIVIAVVIALLVGGTSPWWWKEIFSDKTETTETGLETTETGLENTEEKSDVDVTEIKNSKIWKEGKLTIPLNNFNSGEVADLDSGRLLRLGTSISAAGADISIRQSVHGIVFEPGLSKGDGKTFDARFIAVHDNSVGWDGCSASLINPEVSNHLQLSSDIDVGSHICMVTTKGRMAEFSLTKLNLSNNPRNVVINYVIWSK